MSTLRIAGRWLRSAGIVFLAACSDPGPIPVASVTVAPSAADVIVGDTLRLVATVKDASGNVLPDRPVTWASSKSSFATVTATGLVTGIQASSQGITVTATSENVSGIATITVRQPPVAFVTIAPAPDSLTAGESVTLVATVKDGKGNTLTDRLVEWTSSDTSRARVSPSGALTGRVSAGTGPGPATIIASSEGIADSVSITVTPLLFANVEAGSYHSCGLTKAGVPYCWGNNRFGQIGDGSNTSSSRPAAVAGGLYLVALSVGGTESCGLTAGGAGYCWGLDYYGQLGGGAPGPDVCFDPNGTSSPCSLRPQAVAGGLVFSSLSANWGLSCGLTPADSAYCWGANAQGQLGIGADTVALETCTHGGPCSRTPLPVTGGHVFTAVGTGILHACGLTASGAALCWGDNRYGQLGVGTDSGPDWCSNTGVTEGMPACSREPVMVGGGHTFTALSVGYLHTCGYGTDDTWYCWGSNNYGQLGNGTTGPEMCQGSFPCSTLPVAVAAGVNFVTVSSGGLLYNCGVDSGSSGYCWGANSYGKLGDGTTTNSLTPVVVAGGLSFARLSPYLWHTCGLTAGGAVYCWGRNTWGQLGDGTNIDSAVPVLVFGPAGSTAALTATSPVREQRSETAGPSLERPLP